MVTTMCCKNNGTMFVDVVDARWKPYVDVGSIVVVPKISMVWSSAICHDPTQGLHCFRSIAMCYEHAMCFGVKLRECNFGKIANKALSRHRV